MAVSPVLQVGAAVHDAGGHPDCGGGIPRQPGRASRAQPQDVQQVSKWETVFLPGYLGNLGKLVELSPKMCNRSVSGRLSL